MPTENFLLFEMAEERSTSVGTLLTGLAIPLQQCELELFKEVQKVRERIRIQSKS